MIIHGSRTRIIGAEQTIDHACTACGQSPVFGSTLQRYFHIYWVPVFPLSRKIAVQCGHCLKTEVAAKPTNFRLAKHPLSSFAGLVLIAVFFAAIWYSNDRDKTVLQVAKLNPHAGDTFIMKVKGETEQELILLKVVSVDEGSVNALMSKSTYRSVLSARRAFTKSDREQLLNPQTLYIPLKDFREFEHEDVIRESI